MNIERLRKIIAYSDKNHDEIYSMIKRFCSFAGIEYDSDLLNVLQIVRSSFQKKGFLVLEIPFADDEIGALCYKGDGLGYVVINTSLPKVNTNFAISHEIYHVFWGENEFVSKVEFSDDHYYEHEEEYAANLFAGMLLMPEISFRRMYLKFKEESDSNEVDTIIRLMAYYEVPFMAVLIRCLELRLIAGNAVTEGLLNHDRWEDVDFAQHKIRIQRTVIRIKNLDQTANPDTGKIPKTILYIGPPKTEHSNREIPLPDKLLFYAKRFRKDGSAYILSGTARCMEPRVIQRRYAALLKTCGIPPIKIHALRHQFSCRWVEHGFDTKSLSEILGHTSVRTTLDLYVHIQAETKRQYMNQMMEQAI